MPELTDSVGLPIAVGLGVVLVAWYWAGNEVMRRRAHRLALWAKRVIDPLGGRQSIRWLGAQAFRLEVDGPKAPFRSIMLTGLVESWDVPVVWAWNRLHGRRDMLVLQATLRARPVWGLELFRTGTVLAGDARGFARQEGWAETALEEFVIAAPSDAQIRLAGDLLQVLQPVRGRLLRVAIRRQGDHLTVALNVPDPGGLSPDEIGRLVARVIERLDEH